MRSSLSAIAACSSAWRRPQAHAAAPRDFYGVIGANDPTAAEIARMGAGMVGTLRINFVWGAVQTGRRCAATTGASTTRSSATPPRTASGCCRPSTARPPGRRRSPNYPPSSAYLADFEAFAQAAAERYGANGTFWTDAPEIPKLPVIDWQLWNEANSPSFWYPKPNAEAVRRAAARRSRRDQGRRPAAQGRARGALPHSEDQARDPSRALPAARSTGPEAKPLFDAVAVHPYASTPRDALDDVREVRKIMRQFKDKRTPLWITEIGWATRRQADRAHRLAQAAGRAICARPISVMAANRKRLKIAGVIWYSWRDVPGWRLVQPHRALHADFAPKPAWNAFARLTGGTP